MCVCFFKEQKTNAEQLKITIFSEASTHTCLCSMQSEVILKLRGFWEAGETFLPSVFYLLPRMWITPLGLGCGSWFTTWGWQTRFFPASGSKGWTNSTEGGNAGPAVPGARAGPPSGRASVQKGLGTPELHHGFYQSRVKTALIPAEKPNPNNEVQ